MRRVRAWTSATAGFLHARARIHLPLLVGAAVALGLDAFLTVGQANIVIVLGVGLVVGELLELDDRGRRIGCERAIARAARDLLNAKLNLTRIDQVTFGDVMTLRRLAGAARASRIQKFVTFGGPAQTLARVLPTCTSTSSLSSLKSELGRCRGCCSTMARSRECLRTDREQVT